MKLGFIKVVWLAALTALITMGVINIVKAVSDGRYGWVALHVIFCGVFLYTLINVLRHK